MPLDKVEELMEDTAENIAMEEVSCRRKAQLRLRFVEVEERVVLLP